MKHYVREFSASFGRLSMTRTVTAVRISPKEESVVRGFEGNMKRAPVDISRKRGEER